jgi:hypothetical protein
MPNRLLGRPGTEEPSYYDQFPDVVRRVIGGEQQLSEIGLPLAMRNRGLELDVGVPAQPLERRTVSLELLDAVVPGTRASGRRLAGPVIGGPGELPVAGIDAEVEDIMLGDAEVLEQLPGGVGKSPRVLAPQCIGQIGHGGVEARVGIFPGEQLGEVLTEQGAHRNLPQRHRTTRHPAGVARQRST